MCRQNLANTANFNFRYTIPATLNVRPCLPFNPLLLEGHEMPVLLLLTLKRKKKPLLVKQYTISLESLC